MTQTVKIKKILIRILRFGFDTAINTKRLSQSFFVKILSRPLEFISRQIFSLFLVPGYKVYLKLKNKARDLLGISQGIKLYLFTHRRTTTLVIIGLTVFTSWTNWQLGETRIETQFGQKLLLASLIKNTDLDILVEKTVPSIIPEFTTVINRQNQEFIESVPQIPGQQVNETTDSLIYFDQDQAVLFKPESPFYRKPEEEVISNRNNLVNYIVQNGDTVISIAQHFGLKTASVLANNNLNERSTIRPGDILAIPPIDGINHTISRGETLLAIAQKYQVDVKKIVDYNNLVSINAIITGQTIFVPGGVKKIVAVPRSKARNFIDFIIPSPAPIVSLEKMLWPTTSHRLTQYFSWRHTGIDIGGPQAFPIYAADDGVVSVSKHSGWNGGYGNHIIIDHKGTKKTLYGHLVKNFTQVGDVVKKGQTIGLMGTTGHSTGVHLHFEVRFGRTRVNPLKYVRP